MANEQVLALVDVSCAFPGDGTERHILGGVSFVVKRGEVVVVLGPSGIGKTTLLRLIAGLQESTEGEVVVEGERVDGPSSSRAMVFQDSAVFPWFTVRGNIEYGTRAASRGNVDWKQGIVASLLSLAGLDERLDDYPKTLSTGMRRLVELARALATRPAVLLGDELFAGLDAFSRRGVREILLKVIEEYCPTMVLTTHDVEDGVILADRVLVLNGNPARIAHEYVIPFDRPRDEELLFKPDFVKLRREIQAKMRREG